MNVEINSQPVIYDLIRKDILRNRPNRIGYIQASKFYVIFVEIFQRLATYHK